MPILPLVQSFLALSRFNLIFLKFARFSPDKKSSQNTNVPRRPILPLFDPFSLSVCAAERRTPISIQPHLAFISKWWRGTMVALFSVPLFFLLPFFYIKARRASSDRQHCTFDCTVLQETDFFFLLSLTDKRRFFDRKFVFRGPRIMYLGPETLVVKIWCLLHTIFQKFLNSFFLHQSLLSLIRQTALHIWLHSATRDRFFFFLSLTDKRRLLTESLFLQF